MLAGYKEGLGDMKEAAFKQGMLVEHKKWGLGKIVFAGDKLHIFFKDLNGSYEDVTKPIALSMSNQFLTVPTAQSHPELDNLPPFTRDGKLHVPSGLKVTHSQARDSFRRKYPGGFLDTKYLQDERDYKFEAHELFVSSLGNGHLEKLIESGNILEIVQRLQSVVSKVNLLSQFETMAIRDGFKQVAAAETFAKALSHFLHDAGSTGFDRLVEATDSLPAEKGKAPTLRWPVVTLLPFLADPTRFMFLKPKVTQQAAQRLAFDLLYTPKPNWGTYSKLLEMSDLLMNDLREFGARDYMDVQSFIWVVGDKKYSL